MPGFGKGQHVPSYFREQTLPRVVPAPRETPQRVRQTLGGELAKLAVRHLGERVQDVYVKGNQLRGVPGGPKNVRHGLRAEHLADK